MKKTFLLVFIGLLGLTILSACQSVEGKFEVPPSPTIDPTQFINEDQPVVGEPVELTPEIQKPTPVSTAEPGFDLSELNCGEVFCSVSWPGWLERPIGEGLTRTIDHTYPFGSTADGLYDLHHGVEFLNRHGTPVLAAQDGEVVFAGMDNATKLGPFYGFYGNVVILYHPALLSTASGVYTLYAHLSEIAVEVGDKIVIGQVLGLVGASGAADGPHLHFETRVDSNDYAHTVNPVLWFAPLEDLDHQETAMLAGLILDQGENPIPDMPLSLKRISDAGVIEAHYYPSTYYTAGMNSHPKLGENFAVPDLQAGNYRLAFVAGRLYEFHFTLEPGSLGFIKVQLD